VFRPLLSWSRQQHAHSLIGLVLSCVICSLYYTFSGSLFAPSILFRIISCTSCFGFRPRDPYALHLLEVVFRLPIFQRILRPVFLSPLVAILDLSAPRCPSLFICLLLDSTFSGLPYIVCNVLLCILACVPASANVFLSVRSNSELSI